MHLFPRAPFFSKGSSRIMRASDGLHRLTFANRTCSSDFIPNLALLEHDPQLSAEDKARTDRAPATLERAARIALVRAWQFKSCYSSSSLDAHTKPNKSESSSTCPTEAG